MKTLNFFLTAAALAAALAMAGCSDDDDPVMPADESRTFTLTVENVSMAADYPVSGVFNTPAGDSSPGPATPARPTSSSSARTRATS